MCACVCVCRRLAPACRRPFSALYSARCKSHLSPPPLHPQRIASAWLIELRWPPLAPRFLSPFGLFFETTQFSIHLLPLTHTQRAAARRWGGWAAHMCAAAVCHPIYDSPPAAHTYITRTRTRQTHAQKNLLTLALMKFLLSHTKTRACTHITLPPANPGTTTLPRFPPPLPLPPHAPLLVAERAMQQRASRISLRSARAFTHIILAPSLPLSRAFFFLLMSAGGVASAGGCCCSRVKLEMYTGDLVSEWRNYV